MLIFGICIVSVGCAVSISTDNAGSSVLIAPDDGIAAIANHKFWSAPIGSDEAAKMVDLIAKQKRVAVVLFTADGKNVVTDETFRVTIDGQGKEIFYIMCSRWAGSNRFAFIDMARYRAAPSRAQTIQDLKKALDEADFR